MVRTHRGLQRLAYSASLLVVLLSAQGGFAEEPLPSFEPQPLLFEAKGVTLGNRQMLPAAEFLAVGQSALAAPIRIEPDAQVVTPVGEEAGLFRFLAYVLGRYQTLREVNEVCEFTYFQDSERFESLIRDDEARATTLQMYHRMAYVDYEVGWYVSSDIYYATLKVHPREGEAYLTPMLLTMRGGKWAVFSGKIDTSTLPERVYWAGALGDLAGRLTVSPAPEALTATHRQELAQRKVIVLPTPVTDEGSGAVLPK